MRKLPEASDPCFRQRHHGDPVTELVTRDGDAGALTYVTNLQTAHFVQIKKPRRGKWLHGHRVDRSPALCAPYRPARPCPWRQTHHAPRTFQHKMHSLGMLRAKGTCMVITHHAVRGQIPPELVQGGATAGRQVSASTPGPSPSPRQPGAAPHQVDNLILWPPSLPLPQLLWHAACWHLLSITAMMLRPVGSKHKHRKATRAILGGG